MCGVQIGLLPFCFVGNTCFFFEVSPFPYHLVYLKLTSRDTELTQLLKNLPYMIWTPFQFLTLSVDTEVHCYTSVTLCCGEGAVKRGVMGLRLIVKLV